MGTDYVAMRIKEEKDAEQHGVKGMKWGIRRPRSVLRAEAAKRTEAPKAIAKPVDPAHESSPARYARLAAQAKSGGASSMSEVDLKFFNARTEALAKIDKLNQTDPSWLSKTGKKVLQTTAERTLQSVTDAVAGKYISGPIIESLKGSADASKAKSEPSKPKEPKLPKPNYVGFANPNKK